jgi:hypothetical protein
MSDLHHTLPKVADYYPIIGNRYVVEPGLYAFPTDFDQGDADKRVFQLDTTYRRYLQVKQAARQERLSKYYRTQGLTRKVQTTVCNFIINQLIDDYPQYFQIREADRATRRFENRLTGSGLTLRRDAQGGETITSDDGATAPQSLLDAVAMQTQEDLAVISRDNHKHWLSAIHLCYPNHWAAEEKIGRSFAEIHRPVAHFERIAEKQDRLVDAMIRRGPYVRFAWGLSTDPQLNHHPVDTPVACRFDPATPQLYLRLERQCIVGFPAQDCALFTIRTYCYNVTALRTDSAMLGRLHSAVESMSDDALRYKGLDQDRNNILRWLANGAQPGGATAH